MTRDLYGLSVSRSCVDTLLAYVQKFAFQVSEASYAKMNRGLHEWHCF